MITLPYINTRAHLKAIMQRYDSYATEYNNLVNAKRKDDPDSKLQTLKPTHRSLFQDLIFETGARMLERIGEYEKIRREQGEASSFMQFLKPIDSASGIMCRTNRMQLSKRNGKDVTTIYRNIRRLTKAGVINGIVNHGKYNNFELFINSDFLFVSDHQNPAFNPIMAGSFFSPQLLAKCKVENIKQEHLKNKINSADAVNVDNLTGIAVSGDTTLSAGQISNMMPTADRNMNITSTFTNQTPVSTGTGTGTEGKTYVAGRNEEPTETNRRRNWKPTGGPGDQQNILTENGLDAIDPQKYADTREKKQDYNRISYSVMIVNYLIEKIYGRRMITIFPEARLKAIDYVMNYYFPDPFYRDKSVRSPLRACVTFQDYVNRAEMLKWCIDAANRYAAKNKAFFVMINQYIDVKNPNGLFPTLKWYTQAKQREADKELHKKNREDIRKFQNMIQLVMNDPTQATLEKAENYVQNVLPKYIHLFRRTIATAVNQINDLAVNQQTNGKPAVNQ